MNNPQSWRMRTRHTRKTSVCWFFGILAVRHRSEAQRLPNLKAKLLRVSPLCYKTKQWDFWAKGGPDTYASIPIPLLIPMLPVGR